MQNATPIELEVIGTSTVHAVIDGMKIPTLCLKVSDTENLDSIIMNTDKYPRFVITHVKPMGKNNEKAEIIFREQTAVERASNGSNEEEYRSEEAFPRFEVPEGTITDLFAGLEGSLEYSMLTEGADDLRDSISDILSVLPADSTAATIVQKLQSTLSAAGLTVNIQAKLIDPETGEELEDVDVQLEPEDSDEFIQTYKIVVPLSTIDLGHHMWSTTESSPAFVLATDQMLTDTNWYSDANYVWEDFLAVVEFADLGSDEYSESTVEMMKAVSGRYLIQPTASEFATARATLLSLIFKLSKGDEDALKELFAFVNPINRIQPANPDKLERPRKEDYMLYSIQQVMDMMYEITAPNTMYALLDQAGAYDDILETIPEDEHIMNETEWSQMNDLFSDEALGEAFDNIMDEEYAKTGVILPEEADEDDIYDFYAVKITPNTFPKSMKNLVDKINVSTLYERDWNGDSEPFEITKTNAGMVFVSQVITLAVRYARLYELANEYDFPFSPVGVFVNTVAGEQENINWLLREAAKALIEEQEGLFREILSGRLPDTVEERIDALQQIHPKANMPKLLVSSAFVVIHNVAHSLVESEVSEEMILSCLSENSSLRSFVSNLLSPDDDDDEEDSDDDEVIELGHGETCWETIATIEYLTSESVDREAVLTDLIELLEGFGMILGLRDTDLEQGSMEWDNWLKSVYGEIVS